MIFKGKQIVEYQIIDGGQLSQSEYQYLLVKTPANYARGKVGNFSIYDRKRKPSFHTLGKFVPTEEVLQRMERERTSVSKRLPERPGAPG